MRVHYAKIDDDIGVGHFASLDGERWVEVTHKPSPDDADTIRDIIKGDGASFPIRIATRWLRQRNATFES